MSKLNKDSSIPLYQQLMEEIKAQIITGALKANDRILTEIELSKEYDVSRITVRKAIELMVEDGILLKRQGIGTFVAERVMNRNISGFMSFSQSCLVEGTAPGAVLIAAELADATVVDAEQLRLQENEKILRIVRVRTCDGVPVMLEENHFPARFAFLLSGDLTVSLYQTLAEHGIIMASGIKKIGLCYANGKEEKYLGVPKEKALLLVKDVSFDKEGNPVHNTKSVVNPDRYRMTVMINT